MTILYLTDNCLDARIADLCCKHLEIAAGGLPIVSVSQAPIELGRNVCVGPLGRSAASLEKQILAGLDQIDTEHTAIAEHDVLYAGDHFQFVPPDDRCWFDANLWILSVRDWAYTYRKRTTQSMMVGKTKILRKASKMKLEIVSDPAWVTAHPMLPVGEPGAAKEEQSLQRVKEMGHLHHPMTEYCRAFQSGQWKSSTPCIDIRHGGNLTGGRRAGGTPTYGLEPWGPGDRLWT